MGQAVAIRDAGQHYASAPLAERQKYALTLASAYGLLPPSLRGADQHETAARFMLVAETGAMLGVHPLAAVTGIHVIDGKPTLSPGLMSGIVRAAGHKIRVRVSGEGDALQAKATLVRSDDPEYPFEATWTIERAKRAGLFGKGTWQKYPEAMLKARAIAEVCREGAEDVLMGVRYVPEELDAAVDESGDFMAEAEAETPQSQPYGEVIEDAVVEQTVQPQQQSAWDAAQVVEFLARVRREVDMAQLRSLYDEAVEAGTLGVAVDEQGTTIEYVVMERRQLIQDGKATVPEEEPEAEAEVVPEEEQGPESVPMALDVEDGAS